MAHKKKYVDKQKRGKGAQAHSPQSSSTKGNVQNSGSLSKGAGVQISNLVSSPSVSQTLGEEDTDLGLDGGADSHSNGISGENEAHKVLDEMSQPVHNSDEKEWTSLFKDNRKTSTLQQLSSFVCEGDNVVLDEEDYVNLDESWGSALILLDMWRGNSLESKICWTSAENGE